MRMAGSDEITEKHREDMRKTEQTTSSLEPHGLAGRRRRHPPKGVVGITGIHQPVGAVVGVRDGGGAGERAGSARGGDHGADRRPVTVAVIAVGPSGADRSRDVLHPGQPADPVVAVLLRRHRRATAGLAHADTQGVVACAVGVPGTVL
jgi:hypothetical protein